MEFLKFDINKCVLCGVCVEKCPFGALTIEGNGIVVGDACRMCGLCVRNCPEKAIRFEQKAKSFDKDKWKNFLIYVEQERGEIHPVTFELIGEARKMAVKVGYQVNCVIVGGKGTKENAEKLAVAVRSKDSNMKQLASAAGVSALMGITEPALYGVTLKLKRPVVAASIAAGIGGIVGGLLQVSLYIAQNCIMAIPAFIGEKGLINLIYGIIMIVVSFVAAFVLTLIFGFEDVKAETEDEVQNTDTEKQPAQQNAPLVEKIELCAPVAGTVKALSDVPDKTFADKVLGDGAAIVPSEGKVYAPADGTVANIMDSKHGIMFVTESGAEILIHIGLDTVNLNGKYFKSHVSDGDKVKKGKLLVEFDMDAIKKEGYDLITPVVVTNISDYIKAVCMEKEDAAVNAGDKFLTIV